ncbi:MAG: cell division protein FtsZ [Ignavibacteriales bacterium CG_4_9_14_3_um_filter_30_11]|nr:MAG: cell division protein FtsZ [Ignavibacteriales bacterium CG_4_9_14_3_um_filter_30_11]
MSKFATIDRGTPMSAILKVVGVGGGGCNAIGSMINRGLTGVEYVAVNTDAQVLDNSSATHKIQVGTNITRGLGAGADPNVGRKSVEEDREKLSEVLSGSDMVFITAGMGGGTGTGGAPVIASIAQSTGALVVGIVTKPFKWEGKKRMQNAEIGIQELRAHVDSLIVIPNERLLSILDANINAFDAFDKPNEVLYEATRGIADIITVEGRINVDFADVRSVMNQSGEALMGCGIASGENRAIEAAQKAISSPLLEGLNIKGAKSILLNVTGSNNLTMHEINEGNNVIFEAAGEEANVIFGCVRKDEMNDYVSYTVIATGFSSARSKLTITKQEKNEKDIFRGGGFDFLKSTDVDQDDLNVPTIMRVNKPKATLDNEEDIPAESGFKFESSRYNWAKDKAEKKKEEEINSNDDEDSSSFLRMIMD